jgi:hypothetical protein
MTPLDENLAEALSSLGQYSLGILKDALDNHITSSDTSISESERVIADYLKSIVITASEVRSTRLGVHPFGSLKA